MCPTSTVDEFYAMSGQSSVQCSIRTFSHLFCLLVFSPFICFSTFCFFCPWYVHGWHRFSLLFRRCPLWTEEEALASIIRTLNIHQRINGTFCALQVGNPRVELTLSELQDMAARQQQQIENQQQMLVAKVIIIYRS